MKTAIAIALAGVAAGTFAASAGVNITREAISLAPHRAIYDLSLDKARAGAGVVDVTGRMVYELTGSACEGYTQNMRFVTRMTNQEGTSQITDLRSSSWEEGLGNRFRFNASQYRDETLAEATTGDASRAPPTGDVKVELSKPQKKGLSLSKDVMFPVQHSRALLEAAADGKTVFQADLYDGSEQGEKVYSTTAIIGKALTGARSNGDLPKVKNGEKLDGIAAWPVTISYFEPGQDKSDTVPVYELGFRYYANGVSRKLQIDYGEFSIKGELSKLEFIEPSRCEKDGTK